MRILGYGEDSLTYWALSQHVTDVISPAPLNDDSLPEMTLFIYRPSFGRAGGSASPQFGEFDAIVATEKGVYLIESKWTGTPISDGRVRLAETQIRRHEVFRWIRERWLAQAPANWTEFYSHNGNVAAFAKRFEDKPLAKPGHRLTSNLQYILQQLPGRNAPTVDVLLYFHLEGDRVIPHGVVGALDFVVVPFAFHPLNPEHGGRVIEMEP